jgi:putative cardiolipin synthase
LALAALGGCATVPLDYPKSPAAALGDTGGTALAQASREWRRAEPDRNGFYPLTLGMDAFGARLALIDRAQASIDAQYFLIKPDSAGLVFAARLLRAADRGVRVRLLLDDVFTTVDDAALDLLDEHPNIEVRIFNPVSRRGVFALNYLGNFRLANRRMHNKAFIADNQMAIVGGRNIAVEYFQLEAGGEFIDFDMLSAGPVVGEVSASFDAYWNHELAIPVSALAAAATEEEAALRKARGRQRMAEAGDSIYAAALHTKLMEQIFAGAVSPFLADARMIVDAPEKLQREVADEHKIVASEIAGALDDAQQEVIIFTPYFIPGERGMERIRSLRQRGLRVVLVTNGLATNNHTAVHSAYSTYRKDILRAGVELWEARVNAVVSTAADEATRLTLHTKGVLIDRRRVFVGSLNLDRRSIDINTEMGLLIDSEALATHLTELALDRLPKTAYRLQLDERDRITWHATIAGQEVVETRDPLTSPGRRFAAWLLRIAPEGQL